MLYSLTHSYLYYYYNIFRILVSGPDENIVPFSSPPTYFWLMNMEPEDEALTHVDGIREGALSFNGRRDYLNTSKLPDTLIYTSLA